LPGGSHAVVLITLNLMLLYFLVFLVRGWTRRSAEASLTPVGRRANRAIILASVLGAGTFVLMLGGYGLFQWNLSPYIELAAMLTSVPFTVAIAYRMYHFPFMDIFVREVLSCVVLLALLVVAISLGMSWQSPDLLVFWTVACAIGLSYAKGPVSRWVERTLIGYQESVQEQEERIGNAIRGLTQLDQFAARVSEIVRCELDAEWVTIGSAPVSAAVQQIEIPGPSALYLSLGPRTGRRHYMSRHLRVARTAALQLSTHRQQLSHHELRASTARAQMRALQAQINPHFLFNTLNVLANLIHTNPEKAERVTEQLAEIFRYALESTRTEWVKLDDELRFLEAYLEIEKARFEERLAFRFDVAPAARSLLLPPMILQPLVENAVKHGIGPKITGGEVRLIARVEQSRLLIAVEDTGVGRLNGSLNRRERGAGIGLANVRERLKHLYGDETVLQLEDLSDGGTRALLELPQFTGVLS
jgi:hypothetical protein